MRRRDDDALRLVATGIKRLPVIRDPPVRAVVTMLVHRLTERHRSCVVHPARWQQTPPLPQTIAQKQMTKPREIPRAAEAERRAFERACVVEFRRRAGHAQRPEQTLRHELRHPGGTAANESAEVPGEEVGRAARVVEDTAGRVLQRLVRGEVRDVRAASAEQHRYDVGHAAVDVVLHPGQPAAHVQQVAGRDRRARIAGRLPLGRKNGRVDIEDAIAHEEAGQRVRDALGHRPGLQRRGRIDTVRIALADDLAMVRDEQRQRGARAIRQIPHRVDGGRETGCLRRRACGPVPRRPGSRGILRRQLSQLQLIQLQLIHLHFGHAHSISAARYEPGGSDARASRPAPGGNRPRTVAVPRRWKQGRVALVSHGSHAGCCCARGRRNCALAARHSRRPTI